MNLAPSDVRVQLIEGSIDASGELRETAILPMNPGKNEGPGRFVFTAHVSSQRSGMRGFAVRILPRHPDEPSAILPGLVLWAGGVSESKPEYAMK